MEKVFLYSTLRQGEQYHDWLGNSRLFSLLAQAKGKFTDSGGVKPNVSPAYYSALEERFRHVFNYMG